MKGYIRADDAAAAPKGKFDDEGNLMFKKGMEGHV